jgi:FkbM family methyltransferase
MQYWHGLLNDRWIVESVYPGLRGGYFVEAGACTGKQESATYVLETELGWDGICVEPVDFYFERLVEQRECATDSRCLWHTSGEEVTFAYVPDKAPRSGIEAVNKNLTKEGFDAETERVTKPTVTLADLLAEHGAPETVHYLALDIEGAEEIVLGAFDFDGPRRILAISVEGPRCDDLLLAAGYVRAKNPFAPSRIDRYFLHPSLAGERPDLVA